MDARAFAAATIIVAGCPALLSAARFETDNFIITAPDEAFARQVGEAAEYYRHHLAIEWLGKPLPGNWSTKCPIKCKVGQIGAGGATTFTFNNGEVFGWHMSIQGTEQRILDSVLPHEVSHMIFASYFRRPLPRWADEGAATLVEHESERLRQTRLLDQVIRTSKRIPLQQLLQIKEYPQDMQDVLTLYAEGYSLADYLVQQKGEHGKAIYLKFLDDAHHHGWDAAFKQHYETSVAEVEQKWTGWILAGSPTITPAGDTLLASAEQPEPPRRDMSAAVAAADVEADAVEAASGEAVDVQTASLQDAAVVRAQSTEELTPLASLNRPRRSADADAVASLAAPRPASLAPSAADFAHMFGEHRTTAQPRQPAVVEPIESPRRPRDEPTAVAESRTASDAWSRDGSFGHSRPISFDAPDARAADMTSPASIEASGVPQEAGAANGLGPDSTGGFASPGRPDDGRNPSYRGFTPGRSGPPASARGLFSP
jgi:hypothetical protein